MYDVETSFHRRTLNPPSQLRWEGPHKRTSSAGVIVTMDRRTPDVAHLTLQGFRGGDPRHQVLEQHDRRRNAADLVSALAPQIIN